MEEQLPLKGKSKVFSKITRVNEPKALSTIRADRAKKMYLSEPGNWPTLSENTGIKPR